MTLYGDFLKNNHYRVHKWYQYFALYELHFARFRNLHVTVFEIGVGEGGSLLQWRDYFGPFAIIVGIDIYPRCKQLEDSQIHVRIGSQDDLTFLAEVVAEFGHPDIVIDDGSHFQPHINATFDFLFPLVAKNGVYLVEDLHAAYWPDHGGGLRHTGSFIERAKSCVDEMHAEYSIGALPRSTVGDRITSISFYDSVVVFEIGEYRVKGHRLTGNPAVFNHDWTPAGESPENYRLIVAAALADKGRNQCTSAIEAVPTPPPPAAPSEALPVYSAAAKLEDRTLDCLQHDIEALRMEVALLRESTSWRIAGTLRAVGRFLMTSLIFTLPRKYRQRLGVRQALLKTPFICQTGPKTSAKSGWSCSI